MVDVYCVCYFKVELLIKLGNLVQLLVDLVNYVIDVVVLVSFNDDVCFYVVFYVDYVVVLFVYCSYLFYQCEVVLLVELDQQLLIMWEQGFIMWLVLEQVLQQVGVQLQVVMEIGSCEVLCEVVVWGLGLGVVFEVEFILDECFCMVCIVGDFVFMYIYVYCLVECCEGCLVGFFMKIVWCV